VSVETFVRDALSEDVGRGDLYAKVAPAIDATGTIVAKCDGVLAGALYADEIARLEGFEIDWHFKDGDRFSKSNKLATIQTDSHTLLKCERTILNIILHASSIATLTKQYVQILKPYNCKLLDTRKTRPLLREFEKYATRVGGAQNHRMGLDDSLMLKDTHLRTIEDLADFIKKARSAIPFTTKIEVEAESVQGALEAFMAGADIVMCDNMDLEKIVEVVSIKNSKYPHVLIESSGNICLKTIEQHAKCGVDAISCGSLIHQANWIDLSMKCD